jgi:hypothetical protein
MIRTLSQLCFVTILFVLGCASTPQKNDAAPKPKVVRENIEWCDIWVTSANKQDKPSVLLVGDSITKGYYNRVAKLLEQEVSCARFATSACVADPAFHKQLEAVLNHNSFSVIHFNNGLHGVDYTQEEYQAGYEQALQTIREKLPSAKLVLALSTPLQSGSNKDFLNAQVNTRNTIVQGLAEKYDAQINDLHSLSKDHPEYYRDPYHYKPEAIRLQGQQVAKLIKPLLTGD